MARGMTPKKAETIYREQEGNHHWRLWRHLSFAPLSAMVLLGSYALPAQQQPQTQPATQPQTAQLPPPPIKLDVEGRRKDLLAHLNEVIQFYRSSTTPAQKIGEPNDIMYRDQAVSLSTQAAQYAFQSARAESDLIAEYQRRDSGSADAAGPAEQQRMQTSEMRAENQISDLKAKIAAIDQQLAGSPKNRAALQAQRKQFQGALDLANAMKDALGKIIGSSDAQGAGGLAGDIESLQRSLPQLESKTLPVAAQLESLDQALSSGVSSQTIALFQLLEARHSLDELIADNDALHKQTLALRAPISQVVRGLVTRGQQLSQQAEASVPTPPPAPTGNRRAASNSATAAATSAAAAATASANTVQELAGITTTFKAVTSASVPLSQEIIVLEQSQSNLTAWRAAVNREYASVLQALLLRLLVIAIALGIIFIGGEVWTRATNKYIREARRRRQLLIMRRTVVGFLSAIVLLFGFITQFNSLATFAGFITAGVAVGLQTILLSVAAYFFIIGRYGIKVGDRITITAAVGPAVTGEVIEVGLVRFYMMELAGTGTDLNPTGRVAAFSNAVLFQTGAPVYKQIPGTEYAWHELTIKLAETADYKHASTEILSVVHSIYEQYRPEIERQHRAVESWFHSSINQPGIESRVQFEGGSLLFWARFPVQIKNAPETDEQLTEALLRLFAKSPEIKGAVASTPLIQPTVKG
ncbi:MAG TPA: mechanosensitive ion channel protein MscS [Granulicella sp.]